MNDLEPIWDTVSRVYERYLDLTFDERLTEEDRSKWISVKSRQPGPLKNAEERGWGYWGTYIVCCAVTLSFTKRMVIPAQWMGEWKNDGGFPLSVTHWQPMPEPPKDG